MTQIPTLAQLLKQAIDHRLMDVHTAMIAKVESYDAKKQLVDVVPTLKRRLQNLDAGWVSERLPMLCDIPVSFPRAGGYFISFPIQPGDFVQLIFNEVDIEEWLLGTEPATACSQRFTLQGAIAIPGIFPQSKALLDADKANLVLGKEQGLQIHIDGEKIRLGSANAEEALAIARKVNQELDRIINTFNNHSHLGSMGPIKPDSVISPSGDIATEKVVAQ